MSPEKEKKGRWSWRRWRAKVRKDCMFWRVRNCFTCMGSECGKKRVGGSMALPSILVTCHSAGCQEIAPPKGTF